MATIRSTSGKSNTFTSNTSIVQTDALFSVQDFYTIAIPPHLRPSRGLWRLWNALQAVLNLPSTESSQELYQVSVTIEMSVLLVSNESTNIGIFVFSEREFHSDFQKWPKIFGALWNSNQIAISVVYFGWLIRTLSKSSIHLDYASLYMTGFWYFNHYWNGNDNDMTAWSIWSVYHYCFNR